MFFNRLAILDLDARSDQPFGDGQHTLLFNGEIYNYPQLRTRLEKHGEASASPSGGQVAHLLLRTEGLAARATTAGITAPAR